MKMVRSIQVSAIVGGEFDLLHCPGGPVGKVLLLQPGEEGGHLSEGHLMIHVMDLWTERRWVRNHVVIEIDGDIDDSARHDAPDNVCQEWGRQNSIPSTLLALSI